MLEHILFGKNLENAAIERRTYFWNSCASLIYAIQSAIVLLIVTRLMGLSAAGRFSIYYVTTQMLSSIGTYAMRNFQVSDAKNEYSFRTYYSSRVISSLAMVIACMGYALISKRTPEGIFVIALLTLYRLIDSMGDVFLGHIQKEGRLDAVSIMRSLQIGIAILAFYLAAQITRDMMISSLAMAIGSMAVFFLSMVIFRRRYPEMQLRFSMEKVGQLLWTCFPIMVGNVLYNYLVNAPKYAIERNLSSEAQAIFNILFMPVFLVSVFSQFIYAPVIFKMGIWWKDHDTAAMRKSIARQIILIIGLTALIALGGYLLGYYLLGLLYGIDLREWRGTFSLLLCMGGVAALASYMGVVLTVIRKQHIILIAYIIAAAIGWRMLDPLIIRSQLSGAGVAYGILMAIVLGIFSVAAIWGLRREGE